MSSGRVEPNFAFEGSALAYFNSAPGPIQAALIAIASELCLDPAIDGETKLMVPIRADVGVSIYGRAYVGERIWMHYDFEDDPPPAILIVNDCGLVSELSN